MLAYVRLRPFWLQALAPAVGRLVNHAVTHDDAPAHHRVNGLADEAKAVVHRGCVTGLRDQVLVVNDELVFQIDDDDIRVRAYAQAVFLRDQPEDMRCVLA